MQKKGDVIFGLIVVVLVVLISLLMMPVSMQAVKATAFGSIVLVIFVIITLFVLPEKEAEPQPNALGPINELIATAEAHMDHDIKKAVGAYKQIRSHYSKLEPEHKSIVLRDIMRLYLKLIERVHPKK
jgi:hypothetical protein